MERLTVKGVDYSAIGVVENMRTGTLAAAMCKLSVYEDMGEQGRIVACGEWLPTKDKNKKRCSNCYVIHLIAQYPHGEANYCPNCGAKMK